jgi:hypothetical protein
MSLQFVLISSTIHPPIIQPVIVPIKISSAVNQFAGITMYVLSNIAIVP